VPNIDPSKLRRARERAALTQAELAARIGGSETTVNRLELGKQPARISTLRRIAATLGVEPGDLLVD
jgi:transcriptional regulator with XRE-family HTH domain